jgi:hypothetical protein
LAFRQRLSAFSEQTLTRARSIQRKRHLENTNRAGRRWAGKHYPVSLRISSFRLTLLERRDAESRSKLSNPDRRHEYGLGQSNLIAR